MTTNIVEKAAILAAAYLDLIPEPKQSVTHLTDTLSVLVTEFTILGKSYRCLTYFDSFDEFSSKRLKDGDTINNKKIVHGDSTVIALYKEHSMADVGKVIAANI
ncbi:MAG: hypothetical protein CMF12_01255 [Idiomarina sp.]|uniref:hypothetical protein n=1 Tax=Idiomarina sp. TaxID=1874361 RepID=UPI000C51DBBD|nr:hypothetical protein [Idiomarina sp.]MBT41128.1 hypothetical protein [Idiomarina sp.]